MPGRPCDSIARAGSALRAVEPPAWEAGARAGAAGIAGAGGSARPRRWAGARRKKPPRGWGGSRRRSGP